MDQIRQTLEVSVEETFVVFLTETAQGIYNRKDMVTNVPSCFVITHLKDSAM